MCYSAQIWADFRKYQRFGGELDIKAYMALAGWTRKAGTWTKVIPTAMRRSMREAWRLSPELAELAVSANSESAAVLRAEIAVEAARKTKAEAKLASKPTKTAANDLRIANNKIKAAERKLEELDAPGPSDGIGRIWPGHFAPVLVRDPETGERRVIPMRYRCRLPGWDAAKEEEKPGTYNARRDSLPTVWRKLFGVRHGLMVVERFYESVKLHENQRRSLVPGEREQKIEIEFTPRTGEDLLVACLWNYNEPTATEPGFYSFAAITDHPPPEVAIAGHDRCLISLREDDLDAWLNPTAHSAAELQAILDRGEAVRPYFEHQLSKRVAA